MHTNKILNCCVIGNGSIGKRHAKNLSFLGYEPFHFSWRNLDLKNFSSFLQSRNKLPVVIIATPTNIRKEIIDICIEKNIPIYVEKPLFYRKEELEFYLNIEEKIKEKIFIGFMMRYHPLIKDLLLNLPEKIYSTKFEIAHDVNQWRKDWVFSKSYASNPDGGGVLLDLCHEIDLCNLILGNNKVLSTKCFDHIKYPDIDFISQVDLVNGNGTFSSIYMDYLSSVPIRRGMLICEGKNIYYDLIQNYMLIQSDSETQRKVYQIDRNDLFLNALKDFLLLATDNDLQNKNAPILANVINSCELISEAWTNRVFVGNIGI